MNDDVQVRFWFVARVVGDHGAESMVERRFNTRRRSDPGRGGVRGRLDLASRGRLEVTAQKVRAVPIETSTQHTARTMVNWKSVRSKPRRVR